MADKTVLLSRNAILTAGANAFDMTRLLSCQYVGLFMIVLECVAILN